MPQKINGKNIGCLPQSVYKDSVKNKTVKGVIAFMLEQSANYHGCLTGDCPHENQQDCIDALRKQFTELNVGVTCAGKETNG